MKRVLFAAVLALTVGPLCAQTTGSSEAQRRLELRRAQLNEKHAVSKLEQQQRLFSEGLASKAELDRAEAERERAKLDTESQEVALANELPSFQVLSAVKRVDALGEVTVSLTLRELERGYEEGLRRSYLVSLQAGQSVVSDPYQQLVTLDGRGHRTVVLPFRLLRDSDDVTILVISGTRREQFPIVLQHMDGDRRIQITCANFSQEGTLGGKVEYPLRLERGSGAPESIRLAVRDLPPVFVSEWIDSDTNAKLSLMQFAENQHSMKVILRIFLPVASEAAWFDRLLPLHVDALPASGSGDPLGGIALQLRPSGVPRLTLASDNLLASMTRGERRTIVINVENLGGAPAHDVMFETDPPIGLQAQVEPSTINELGPRERRQVRLVLTSGADALPAEYNLKLQARAQNRLAIVDSPELSLRVVIRGSAMSMATMSVTTLLLGATIGAVLWALKMIRR